MYTTVPAAIDCSNLLATYVWHRRDNSIYCQWYALAIFRLTQKYHQHGNPIPSNSKCRVRTKQSSANSWASMSRVKGAEIYEKYDIWYVPLLVVKHQYFCSYVSATDDGCPAFCQAFISSAKINMILFLLRGEITSAWDLQSLEMMENANLCRKQRVTMQSAHGMIPTGKGT